MAAGVPTLTPLAFPAKRGPIVSADAQGKFRARAGVFTSNGEAWCPPEAGKDPGQARPHFQTAPQHLCGLSGNAGGGRETLLEHRGQAPRFPCLDRSTTGLASPPPSSRRRPGHTTSIRARICHRCAPPRADMASRPNTMPQAQEVRRAPSRRSQTAHLPPPAFPESPHRWLGEEQWRGRACPGSLQGYAGHDASTRRLKIPARARNLPRMKFAPPGPRLAGNAGGERWALPNIKSCNTLSVQ